MNTGGGVSNGLAIMQVLNLIRVHGPVTRARLGEMSGYSRSTISINSDRLLEMDLIREEPSQTGGRKSKRTQLRVNGEKGVIAGIELGATGCEIGLCNLEAELLGYDSYPITMKRGPGPIMKHIRDTIDALLSRPEIKGKPLLGIGVGLPCSVDFNRGFAVSSSFMPGWTAFPVRDILRDAYQCPVFVDNEVNTMALGEYSLGTDRKYKNMLYVKVGTGIGAGLIINGEIYRGSTGVAGNLGHVSIDGNGTPCKCGRVGCVEAIAGGGAIAEQARKIVESGEDGLLASICADAGQVTAQEVQLAAEAGDPRSIEIIQQAGTVLGEVLGRFVTFLDPSVVIIGGGLAGFGPTYLSFIREGIVHQSEPRVHANLPVLFSTFGDKAGIIGSAILCTKEIFRSGELLASLSTEETPSDR